MRPVVFRYYKRVVTFRAQLIELLTSYRQHVGNVLLNTVVLIVCHFQILSRITRETSFSKLL